jgi:hypothetical protein
MDLAGGSVFKRAAPVLIALAIAVVVAVILRSRKR